MHISDNLRDIRKIKTIGFPMVLIGESMWESNPPGQLLTTCNGFEDRGAHQHPSTPIRSAIIACTYSL